jgi:hypothetical protein
VRRSNLQSVSGEVGTSIAATNRGSKMIGAVQRQRVALWILGCSCYATIGGMVYFFVTGVWPTLLMATGVMTLAFGAPAFLISLTFGQVAKLRRGVTMKQAAFATGGIFAYAGCITLLVEKF